MRQCPNCLRFLSATTENFYPKSSDGARLNSWCKDCTRERKTVKPWAPAMSAVHALNTAFQIGRP
jgi:hypothetical protein